MSSMADSNMDCSLGCCELVGFPENHTIRMTQTIYKNVNIYEEYRNQINEPVYGTQKLRTKDIENEIDKVDKIEPKLMNYISSVVLSPFSCAMDSYMINIYMSSGKTFATSYDDGKIIIFSIYNNAREARRRLENDTLLHELGHIVDAKHGKDGKRVSMSEIWENAKHSDRVQTKYSGYITRNAEVTKSMKEDFADSFVMFIKEPESFKRKFKNRASALESLNIY
jgi:hypothetical protein